MKKLSEMQALIIGTEICPYCITAKKFAIEKGITYEYKVIDQGQPKKPDVEYITMDNAIKLVGQPFRTVPQIIVDGKHVGGCDDFLNYINSKDINDDEFKDMSI